MCKELSDLPYEKRLRALNLPSMHYRRERGDMIQVYKILSGKDRLDTNTLLPLNNKGITRGHSKKLSKRGSRLNIRKYSFGLRVTDAWNSLPEWVVCAKSLNSFKNNLDRFWTHKRYDLRSHACASNSVNEKKPSAERVLQA